MLINNVEEFLKAFKVGDTFWTMESLHNFPTNITKRTITKIGKAENFYKNVAPTLVGQDVIATQEARPEFVSDLTNCWHGCFCTQEDAESYLKFMQYEYTHQPELMAEVWLAKELMKKLRMYDNSEE